MKKTSLLILLLPLFASAQTNGLTLAELRARVLAGSPSVRESLQRIEAADAVLKQARSAYLPTVSLSGAYGFVEASVHPDFDLTNRYSDSLKQATGSLQANWLLFDGFARRARTLAAKYSLEQTRELADETRRLLILSATLSFRQAQQAHENIQTAEQDLAFNRKLEDDARKRFDAGMLPEADVFNFSIRSLQAENSAAQARLDFQAACTVLAELMALPEARLPESLRPVAVDFDQQIAVPEMQREQEFALQNRPDFQAVASGLRALDQQVRAARGDLLPQLVLTGEANYTEYDDRSVMDNYGDYDSFAGVAAKWDLFAGGRKLNAVKEAQARVRALEEQQEALRLSIRSALRRRIDEANTACEVFERQKKIYELTARVRDSIEKAYRAGAVSITRLNETQTDLVRARTGYTASYIACLLVLNRLDIETGRVLTGELN
jgi:outer membrane protein TolC